jgi:hypothetical protein
MNTKLMNFSMLVKCVWRLFMETPDQRIYLKIIRANYPEVEYHFQLKPFGRVSFWHNVDKIKDYIKLEACF